MLRYRRFESRKSVVRERCPFVLHERKKSIRLFSYNKH
ncbi:hypothetical protein DDI_1843 [Dickeya dianthicola RNS04.9]|nr:hypothetical protein DDI_1843 [Dickeya dianthicola RNS04.9]